MKSVIEALLVVTAVDFRIHDEIVTEILFNTHRNGLEIYINFFFFFFSRKASLLHKHGFVIVIHFKIHGHGAGDVS